MDDYAITTVGLTKRFKDVLAVDEMTINVKKGEIFGLLGPNGAGKTTLIRMLCTLAAPTSGTATVAGFDVIKEDAKVREHIGLVSEKMIMYTQLTALENLRLFGNLYNIPKGILNERMAELLKLVQMDKWGNKQIGTFSTGMKQRINVIRALLNQPEVLFLDEPTLGLDPQSTSDLRSFIKQINVQNKTTIVLTTHMMTEADLLCDRIGIIDFGKIVALDTSINLKKIVTGTDISVVDLQISNLTNDMVLLLKSLRSVKNVLQKNDTQITVQAEGPDAFNEIIDTVRHSGGNISYIKGQEPTLEDVFLHITGHEVRDKPGEMAPTGRRGGFRPQATSRIR